MVPVYIVHLNMRVLVDTFFVISTYDMYIGKQNNLLNFDTRLI